MLTTKHGENSYTQQNDNTWFCCFKTSKFVQIVISSFFGINLCCIMLHYSFTCMHLKCFTPSFRNCLNLCKVFVLYHSQPCGRYYSSFQKLAKIPALPFFNPWLIVMIVQEITSGPKVLRIGQLLSSFVV